MMFEAKITANSRYSTFPEEEKKKAKCEEKEEKGTYLVTECGDVVSKRLACDNVITDKLHSEKDI